MKIAIVGSRCYPNPREVADFVLALPPDTIVVSGGAAGVDSWAANIAHFVLGFQTEIKWADWRNLGRRAGFARNKSIVDEADSVVMFWDGESKGTWDTFKRVMKAKKPFTCYNSKGEVKWPKT